MTDDGVHRLTFVVIAIAAASFSLLQSLVSPVLPLLQDTLHTNQSTITWVLTAYLVSASVFTPLLGRIGDLIGKKKVLVAVLVVLALSSVLAALATSVGVMIVARIVQGVGGGVIPLAFGIVRDEFPEERVGWAVGIIASLLAVGGGLGLVLAGPIVNTLNYHWLFWIPGIVVALTAVGAAVLIPAREVRSTGGVSWLGGFLLSVWLVALLIAVSQGSGWGWASAETVGLLAAAAVTFGAWLAAESRSRHPLIDMKMMRIPAVWTTNLVALLFGVALYASFAFLPEFLQTPESAGYGFGASVTRSGMIVLPQTVAMFLTGLVSGWAAARFSGRRVLILGAWIGAIACFLLTVSHSEIWQVTVALTLMGVGFGLAFSAIAGIVVEAVPFGQTGVATGMNANVRTIGGAIGAAAAGSVITAAVDASGMPAESGFTSAFAVITGSMVMTALAAMIIPKTQAAQALAERSRGPLDAGPESVSLATCGQSFPPGRVSG